MPGQILSLSKCHDLSALNVGSCSWTLQEQCLPRMFNTSSMIVVKRVSKIPKQIAKLFVQTFTLFLHSHSHNGLNNKTLHSYPLKSCSLWALHCVCIEGLLIRCTATTDGWFTVCVAGVWANISSVREKIYSMVCHITLISYIQSY